MGSPIAHMLTPIFKCPVDCCKNFFYHRGNFNFNLELLKVKLAKTSTSRPRFWPSQQYL